MCTVTLVCPAAMSCEDPGELFPNVRVFCNRDEQRSRAASLPPAVMRCGDRLAIAPIDPASGGTWMGANDAGVVACLLNGNPPRSQRLMTGARESRGMIVPHLLAAGDLVGAVRRVLDLDPLRFPPFRLLLTDGGSHYIATSGGAEIDCIRCTAPREPLVLTSSSLGDRVVTAPREELFKQMLGEHRDPMDAQSRFHSHSWQGRENISVLMSRADARTVSQTAIDLWPTGAVLRHWLIGEDLHPASGASVCELTTALRRIPVP